MRQKTIHNPSTGGHVRRFATYVRAAASHIRLRTAATCPLIYIIYIAAISLVACTPTECIPEGEQLYLGIKDIRFARDKEGRSRTEEDGQQGVIASIADAYGTVQGLISGTQTTPAGTDGTGNKRRSELSREERALLDSHKKAEQEAFATAKEEIEAALAYEPNASFFGSSRYAKPWKFGLWVYGKYADSGTRFGRWMFKKFGEQPVLISNVAPQTRSKIATNVLRDYGYFRGKVGYDLAEGKNRKAARINYSVITGPVFHLDSIEYCSFGSAADSLLAAGRKSRQLKSGDAFSAISLNDERMRIDNIMRENGYYYWSPAYTAFLADTVAVPGRVQLRVQPAAGIPEVAHHPWYMGQTHINIRDQKNSPLDHEMAGRRGNTFYAWSGEKIPAKTRLWRSAVNHRKGRPYRLSDQTSTITKLSALGILSSMDVSYVPRDTTASCDTLDVYVNAVMGKPYDSSFEVNATLKSSQQLGPGVRYELAKRNAFRGGETVAWDIFGSYEWQLGRRNSHTGGIFNSYELGTSFSIDIPRFAFPFISKRRLRFPASTRFSLETDWKNRSGYFQMLDFGAGITYNWTKRNLRHQWDFLDLDYYRLNHTTAAFEEIMNANPAIYASMRNIFVPSMGYSLTYVPSNNRFWAQWTLKESGNLCDGLHCTFYPHHPKDTPRTILGSHFAQFVKTTAEVHYSRPITENLSLATRAFAGIIYNYGGNEAAPYAEQFYIGGANSVRAFTVRTAGPGSYRTDNPKYAYIDQTGDFKLEANAELRARLVGNLHGAVFLDAGNVWLMKRDPLRPGGELSLPNMRRIALGTGLGIRYDLDFLVLRFDIGMGLHAPYETRRSGFYNFERFRHGVAYHFAIGYPF